MFIRRIIPILLLSVILAVGLAACLSNNADQAVDVEADGSVTELATTADVKQAAPVEAAASAEAEAEEVLPNLDIHPDILVMDPPRSGLKPAVHDAINELKPTQIAYISCDPATLSRDLKKLINKGYQLIKVQPFDVFPQTSHIESIALLERA